MDDSSYEILCSSCRTPMPSTAAACPSCGHQLGRELVPPPVLRAATAPAAPMPAQIVPTVGLRVGGGRAYAGFWIRVAAVVVDYVVLAVPAYLLLRTFGNWAYLAEIPFALYSPLMESSASQGTIGKIVFGLKVTDTSYQRISLRRALGRWLAHLPSGLLLCLGYAMVAFTPQKRALHDYIAGTLVLRV